MKTVMVVYPVFVSVSESDTIMSIMDKADEIFESSPPNPVIQTLEGEELFDDDQLRDYVLSAEGDSYSESTDTDEDDDNYEDLY